MNTTVVTREQTTTTDIFDLVGRMLVMTPRRVARVLAVRKDNIGWWADVEVKGEGVKGVATHRLFDPMNVYVVAE